MKMTCRIGFLLLLLIAVGVCAQDESSTATMVSEMVSEATEKTTSTTMMDDSEPESTSSESPITSSETLSTSTESSSTSMEPSTTMTAMSSTNAITTTNTSTTVPSTSMSMTTSSSTTTTEVPVNEEEVPPTDVDFSYRDPPSNGTLCNLVYQIYCSGYELDCRGSGRIDCDIDEVDDSKLNSSGGASASPRRAFAPNTPCEMAPTLSCRQTPIATECKGSFVCGAENGQENEAGFLTKMGLSYGMVALIATGVACVFAVAFISIGWLFLAWKGKRFRSTVGDVESSAGQTKTVA